MIVGKPTMRGPKANVNLRIVIVVTFLTDPRSGDSHSRDSLDSWLKPPFAAEGRTKLIVFEVIKSYPQKQIPIQSSYFIFVIQRPQPSHWLENQKY